LVLRWTPLYETLRALLFSLRLSLPLLVLLLFSLMLFGVIGIRVFGQVR